MYNTVLGYIKTHRSFKVLRENNLLTVKRINYPITTAFVARDIDKTVSKGSQIQCQFYQFATYSSDCPIYIIKPGEPMYSNIKNIFFNMWKSAVEEENLEVPYIKYN